MAGQLFYFIRMTEVVITLETFETAIQFGTMRGDPIRSLLYEMTCLHAPAVALTTFRDKGIKDNYTQEMHLFLASLTGG